MLRATLFTLLGLAMSVQAQDKKAKPEPGKAIPATTPLSLTIRGESSKFTLDLGGKTPEEFAKLIEAAKKDEAPMPKLPEVKLTLVVKNTSTEEIQVWSKGDPVVLELELKGKGAEILAPRRAFTADFRLPMPTTLAAGKTLEIPLNTLAFGFRNASKFAYWTQAGEYELIATWSTGVSPAPKGAEDRDGFGVVAVSSPAFKITVEEKK